MKKLILFGIAICFIITITTTQVSAKIIKSIEPDVLKPYRMVRLSGNESCWAIVESSGTHKEQLVINVKSFNQRDCYICDDTDRCSNVRINPPTTLPVYDENGRNVFNLTLNLNSFTYSVPDNARRTIRFLKFGSQSIVIAGDNQYNATVSNITMRNKFSYLNMSRTGIYVDLVGYWNFDLDNGVLSYDLSKYQNDGTYINGIVNCTSAWAGCAYGYNSSGLVPAGQGIDLGTDNDLYFGTNPFTISAWVMKGDNVAEAIVKRGTGSSSGANNQQYMLSANGAGAILFRISNGTSNNLVQTNNGVVSVNQWAHVVARLNSSNSMDIFVNGVLLNSTQKTITGVQSQNQTFLAKAAQSIGVQELTGELDEVMLFNASLSNSDIAAIYQNQSSRFLPSGTMLFQNIDLQGNSTVSISLGESNLFGSSIWATFNNGNFVELTNGQYSNYLVTGNLSNANMTLLFLAGNASYNPFYTPFLFGNITLNNQLTASTNVRIYPNTDYDVPFARISQNFRFDEVPYGMIGQNLVFP